MIKAIATPVRAETNGIIGDALIEISERCLDCKFLRNPPLTCEAFIDGIPNEILSGSFDHVEEFKGDHGIVFEKAE